MPRYRARYFAELPGKEPGTVRRLAQGEEFDYEGKPSLWMEPVDETVPPAVVETSAPDTLHGLLKDTADKQEAAFTKLKGEKPKGK